jgi:hypothetical protein
MLARIGRGLLWGFAGYAIGAMLGYFLILQASSNVHDRAMEAGMTAAFVFGPVVGLIGFVVGMVRYKPGVPSDVERTT